MQNASTDAEMSEGELSLGPLDSLIGYHLRRAWNEIRRDFEAELGALGVTRGMIGLLSVVAANPGISQGVAARLLDIARANMVALVADMCSAGWIARNEDAADRRAVSLSLTPDGERVFAEALKRVRVHEERLFGGLSEHSRVELTRMLTLVTAAGQRQRGEHTDAKS